MENNKLTKKDKFIMMRTAIENSDIPNEDADLFIETLDHEIELLSKKSSAPKNSKEQKHTEELMLVIRDVLTRPMRVGEIADLPEIKECISAEGVAPSPNKVSATLKKMITAGEVVRTVDKKVAYFSLAE